MYQKHGLRVVGAEHRATPIEMETAARAKISSPQHGGQKKHKVSGGG